MLYGVGIPKYQFSGMIMLLTKL